jgi:hypothetical protein
MGKSISFGHIFKEQKEEKILAKLRQLSQTRILQLEEYLDFLLEKDRAKQKTA